jgi:hypothetical protein
MTARNHHHVSVFYLEGFTGPVEGYRRPMLFVIDGKEKRSFPASPRDVAFKTDFHRIEIEGYPPDALEKSFGEFESKASAALGRIVASQSLQDADDRACLFELMTLFSIKNPRHRERFRQFQEEVVRHVLRLATAFPERWASEMRRLKAAGVNTETGEDYERMRDFAERGEFKVTMPTNEHLALELQSIEAVLRCLMRRKWMLLRASASQTGFITSDDPICLMWSDPARQGQFKGPGHGAPGTIVIFPLCNELAVLGSFEGDEGVRNLTTAQVAAVNGTIALHAERQVYARDDNFTYQMSHHGRIMRGDEFLADQAA